MKVPPLRSQDAFLSSSYADTPLLVLSRELLQSF